MYDFVTNTWSCLTVMPTAMKKVGRRRKLRVVLPLLLLLHSAQNPSQGVI